MGSLKYVLGTKGILDTSAGLSLPRTDTLSCVPALPYFFSTYPIATFFFRQGLKAPLVTSPICTCQNCDEKAKIAAGASCQDAHGYKGGREESYVGAGVQPLSNPMSQHRHMHSMWHWNMQKAQQT